MTTMGLWITGKSFSEALFLASTNPQYDKRLFMELPWKLQAHILPMFCACTFHGIKFLEQFFVIWLLSWCKNKCYWKRFTCMTIFILKKNWIRCISSLTLLKDKFRATNTTNLVLLVKKLWLWLPDALLEGCRQVPSKFLAASSIFDHMVYKK